MGRIDWPRRILTVVIGIPIALTLLHSAVGMWCLASFLCALCIVEFTTNIASRIAPSVEKSTSTSPRRLVLLSLLVCAAACTGQKLFYDAMMLISIIFSSIFHLAKARRADLSVLSALLLDLLALIFIVGGFGHAILLRSATSYGFGFQVLGLACVWVCDTGALVAGNFLGHRKLAPAVSPGKTIVGAIAGIGSAIFTVIVLFRLPSVVSELSEWLPSTVPLVEQVVVGIVLGGLCIVGDLVESLLKRVADTKDSGTFFPGHGGCLDRMDSFLFVAPALFYYSYFRFSLPNP